MAQPILSIEEDKAKFNTKAVANLLPCCVHHDGPVDPIDAYWKPTASEDGMNTAYFRGRKLHGKTVALPEQYRGVVVERKANEPQNPTEGVEDRDEQMVEIGTMKVTAGFDEIVVWGHEEVASAETDLYIRSIEEWLQIVEQIHSYLQPDGKAQK